MNVRQVLRIVGLVAPVLCVAAPASATRIDFVWADTGSKHITVLPGSEVVLEARVTVEAPGIIGVAVSALATVGLLEALDFEVCPLTPGNPFGPGVCGPAPGQTLTAAGVGNVVLNGQNAGAPGGSYDPTPIPGLSGSFAALSVPTGGIPEGATFALAHITYSVVGLGFGEVLPYYREGVDGAVDIGATYYLPLADGADVTSGLSLQVIPEPAGFVLLVGGLLLLGARRKRR